MSTGIIAVIVSLTNAAVLHLLLTRRRVALNAQAVGRREAFREAVALLGERADVAEAMAPSGFLHVGLVRAQALRQAAIALNTESKR